MVGWLKEISRKMASEGGVFMFIRAQLSAQIATLVDFLVTILLVSLFDIYYVYATFIGAVYGGIVNGVVNYRWTFKATGCKKINVAIKFVMVWLCSIGFNTWGTYLLTEQLGRIPWVKHSLSLYFGDYFILSKVVVAIIVAICWNYNMQRWFVYRKTALESFFERK